MEKGFEYWLHNQRTNWQTPYSNSFRDPFEFGQQNIVPTFANSCSKMLSPNENLPMFAFSSEQQPYNKAAQQPLEPPRGWFYCMPRFRQAFSPVLNSVPKEKPTENRKEAAVSTEVQKRFVVFDQSGDQTTLLFSSGIDDSVPYQRFPSWNAKPYSAFDLQRDEPALGIDNTGHSFPPLMVGECKKENEKEEVKSEMHEDTEELNALLYSDDEVDYSEDEEETSTGHSPVTMTGYGGPELLEENGAGEEVASSAGPIKRQKLVHGYYGVPSLMDTATSVKTNKRCLDYEDDAESIYCGDGKNQIIEESGNKRLRKDKIRETTSILQDLIPGGNNGHDAITVLDEAIHYLTSLKVKAKAFLLDSSI